MNNFLESLLEKHIEIGFLPLLGDHPSYWKNIEKSGIREVAFSGNLGWLMDPKGNHQQKLSVSQRILDEVRPELRLTDEAIVTVESDYTRFEFDKEGRKKVDRLDIVVVDESANLVICVEVKVRSKEHSSHGKSQLEQYYEQICHNFPLEAGWEHVFIYLTPSGKAPDSSSRDSIALNSAWYKAWSHVGFKSLWPILEDVIDQATLDFNETRNEDAIDTRCIARDLYAFSRVEYFNFFERTSHMELVSMYENLIADDSQNLKFLLNLTDNEDALESVARSWNMKMDSSDFAHAKDSHRSVIEFKQIRNFLLYVKRLSEKSVPTSSPDLEKFSSHLEQDILKGHPQKSRDVVVRNLMDIIKGLKFRLEEAKFQISHKHKEVITWQNRDHSLTVWDGRRRAWIKIKDSQSDPYLEIRYECRVSEITKFDSYDLKAKLQGSHSINFYAPLLSIGHEDRLKFAEVRLEVDNLSSVVHSLKVFAEALR